MSNPDGNTKTVFSNKESSQDIENFQRTLDASHRILYDCRTVFPFDLFPDRIIIDENKVDLIYGIFFFTNQVFTIPIKNINGATSTTGIFFGSLDIEIMGYNVNPESVRYLHNNDAIALRRVINGLVIAYKEGIVLSKLPLDKAKNQIEEIGRAREPT